MVWYDGFLKANLDIIKEAVKDDWDMFFIVDGLEGSGKSVLAQQVAGYLDPSLTIDRICFTPEEFIKAVNEATKYQAIVYDEAYAGLASRSALSEVNRMIVRVLAEMRQKNLFVFIVMPCFFELDKYAAVWRSKGLFHVYTKNLKRGFFRFYNSKKKKQLYLKGKKFYEYKVLPDFYGKFPKGYFVDEAEYRAKKLQVLKTLGEQKESPSSIERRYKNRLITIMKHLIDTHQYTQEQIGSIINVQQSHISELLKDDTH